jgi:hypothetical protein
VSFSAAAKTLVERGERCPQCGGELALAERERQPVGVLARRHSEASEPPEGAGHFDRE